MKMPFRVQGSLNGKEFTAGTPYKYDFTAYAELERCCKIARWNNIERWYRIVDTRDNTVIKTVHQPKVNQNAREGIRIQ